MPTAPRTNRTDAPRSKTTTRFLVRLRAGVFPLVHEEQQSTGLSCRRFPGSARSYYCGVGAANAHGRACVESTLSLHRGRPQRRRYQRRSGAGQWEFQIFAKGAKRAGDEIWVARYSSSESVRSTASRSSGIRSRSASSTGTALACTPTSRTALMRTCGDKQVFMSICEGFGGVINRHISVYGAR